MERYIAQENIKRFAKLLAEPLDSTCRKMVLRLLSLEQAKLTEILKAQESRSEDVDCFFPDFHPRQSAQRERA